MDTTIRVDVSKALADLRDYRANAIPYALSKTLTGLALDSREAVLRGLPSRMKFRTGTGWLRHHFRVVQANKSNLAAQFVCDLDYMNLQQFTNCRTVANTLRCRWVI